jgi:16S rRNA (guanine527-N7)-methyltransferase
MLRTALREGADRLDVPLSPHQLAQFERYAADLVEWNRHANLTSITDPLDIVRKHFLDSLTVLSVCHPEPGARIIDVGSGAGFPGLPLRIARPDLRVALLEATRKKCDFLRHVVDVLALDNVHVVSARAEDAARDAAHRERYDVSVARAVAEAPMLMEYLLPFVRVRGCALAMKSGEVEAEVERAGAAITMLGGQVRHIAPVSVPGVDEPRYVVVVDKVTPTPDKYPRRAGMPHKRPIGG